MNALINVGDAIAALSFLVTVVIALRLPGSHPRIGRSFRFGVAAAAGLYLFVSTSNVLEHAALIPALDRYEDFAELLFVPLCAYVIYSRWTSDQLEAAQRAERLIRAEHELLMGVMDTTPTGILVVDGSGAVSFANDLARQMICPEAAPEAPSDDCVTPGSREELDLGRVVAAAPVAGVLETLRRGDATTYLSVSATPLDRSGGAASGAVLALQDVTDRVLIELELEQYRHDLEAAIDRRTSELLELNRQLMEANNAKQEFLANMSHELRTPLNSIIGFTDLMLRELPGPLTEEQRRQLDMVKASGSHLLELVNEVLDIARIEAGFATVETAPLDVGAQACETAASMSALAAVQGVELRCTAAEDEIIAEADADKLGQIVRNLVSNAVKFTDRGGVVTVSIRRETDAAVLSVSDTGVGIAPEHHERVFEAFQQIDTPNRARPQGTGLGLAICRELCELLGYTIELTSAPGEGSTFTVRIPLDR